MILDSQLSQIWTRGVYKMLNASFPELKITSSDRFDQRPKNQRLVIYYQYDKKSSKPSQLGGKNLTFWFKIDLNQESDVFPGQLNSWEMRVVYRRRAVAAKLMLAMLASILCL